MRTDNSVQPVAVTIKALGCQPDKYSYHLSFELAHVSKSCDDMDATSTVARILITVVS